METIGPAGRRLMSGPLHSAALGPLRRLFWDRDEPRPHIRQRLLVFLQVLGVGWLALLGLSVANEVDNKVSGLPVLVIAVGSVLPIALAVRRPRLAWRIAFPMLFIGATGTDQWYNWPWTSVQTFGFLFVLGRLAMTQAPALTVWATGLSLVPITALTWQHVSGPVTPVAVVAVAALGDILYRRGRTRQLVAEHKEITEQERGRRALLEERARIAREMHDVVAHHMSMIAVRAETAPYRVGGLPENAREELTAIAAAARAALTDMRRLLGALRADDGESPTAPQPGLADVGDLVETARAAGVDVTLSMLGVPDVPETVGLAAYRILQEALANAARHAPGSPVRIEGRGFADRLELTVRNEHTGPGGTGGGHGLIGMRERAVLLGGELTAGPDRSDFLVSATLPVGGRAPDDGGGMSGEREKHR